MPYHCGAGSLRAQTSTLKLHYHKQFHSCHSGQGSPSLTKLLYGCHTPANCPCQRQLHQGSISRLKTFSIGTGMRLSYSHAWYPSGWLQLSHAQTPFTILCGPRQSKTLMHQRSIKNKNLVAGGGKINSYFDFWGRLIQFFPFNNSKKYRFYYRDKAFSNIFLTVLNFLRSLLVDNHYFVYFI